MASKSDYDAIIVGAGIGGLTTGCLLAKTGHRVLILEQHFKVGGFVTSYQRKHYPMDVVHAIGGLSKGAAIDRIFSFLNLYDRLCFNEIEKVFIYRFPECNIDCYTSITRYQDELKRHFPDQSSSVEQIFTDERYTGTTEGGWYDIDCSPRQANLGRIRNKTPINGLYLTGAKTYPGSGMFGSIQAGLFTADSILNGCLTRGRNLLVYG